MGVLCAAVMLVEHAEGDSSRYVQSSTTGGICVEVRFISSYLISTYDIGRTRSPQLDNRHYILLQLTVY